MENDHHHQDPKQLGITLTNVSISNNYVDLAEKGQCTDKNAKEKKQQTE